MFFFPFFFLKFITQKRSRNINQPLNFLNCANFVQTKEKISDRNKNNGWLSPKSAPLVLLKLSPWLKRIVIISTNAVNTLYDNVSAKRTTEHGLVCGVGFITNESAAKFYLTFS